MATATRRCTARATIRSFTIHSCATIRSSPGPTASAFSATDSTGIGIGRTTAGGGAMVPRGGRLGGGGAGGVGVGAVGGVPRVRQGVVTAAAGRLLAAGEMGAGAGTTATVAEGRAAGRN